MKTFLTQIVSDVRVWLGLDDPATGLPKRHLTPRFAWLLPGAPVLVAQRIPLEPQFRGTSYGSSKPRG
jgi:hypothetical protein